MATQATNRQKSSVTRSDLLNKIEWIAAVLLTVMILLLLLVRATHAGALWRDECAVVQLAGLPSVSDVFHNFQHEAFPPLFPLVIRAYTTVFGASDTVLRVFGLCAGCLLISAFWMNARLFRTGPPLIGLALMGLNTTFFVWGTTIRGYGLGSAISVLIFGSIGSLLLAAKRERVVIATLGCLFGVQILLYNSVLVIAIGTAASAIFLFQRRFKQALLTSAISAVAVLSLLPYVPAYLRARDWNIVVRGWPTSYSLWKHFEVALGNPGYSIPSLWYGIAVGLIGVFVFRLYKDRGRQSDLQRQLVWFALLVCGLSVVGCYAFLRLLSYTTSVWYYLAFSCVVAAALDLIASILCPTDWLRLFRLGLAGAVLIAEPFADWSAITERQTNVDLAAQTVTAQVSANDLVVVVPWQLGIPFHRYYRSAAPWTTIPDITDHQVHRYDLIKAKMLSAHPIDNLTEKIRATLSSGNRVWFVGGLNLPRPEEGPMVLPPAPASRFKWDNRAYTASWWQQLSVFAVIHANKADPVPLPQPKSIRLNKLEEISLSVVEGWHDQKDLVSDSITVTERR